jgi:hypothetical protein
VTEAGRVKFYHPREGDGTGVVELDSGAADVTIDGEVVLAAGLVPCGRPAGVGGSGRERATPCYQVDAR